MDETYSAKDDLNKTPRGSIHTNAFDGAVGSDENNETFRGMDGPTLFSQERGSKFEASKGPSYFADPGSSFRVTPYDTVQRNLN